jgi:ubiquitin C-terminal hydrolase
MIIGHYVTYARVKAPAIEGENNSASYEWMYFSDSKVCKVSQTEVLNSPAYMLFYDKIQS